MQIQFAPYTGLVYQIIGAAMEVHSELGPGLLESVYQEALCLELKDRGIESDCEVEIPIFYKDTLLEKKFKMDLVVGGIVVELKSVSHLVPAHRAQLCNYLRLTKRTIGILVNFGEESLRGERWALDISTNQCLLIDRDMQPVYDADYETLLS